MGSTGALVVGGDVSVACTQVDRGQASAMASAAGLVIGGARDLGTVRAR
ncbi:hypothetical protein AB0F91_40120 [Amycolatopsis sp. NPDC023774]